MLNTIKDLYLAGYRFYIKDNTLYLNTKNVITPKNFVLNKLQDPAKKELIKTEIKKFKTINLNLNNHTLEEITAIMSNKYIDIICCDFNKNDKTITLVFNVLSGIDPKDLEYIKILMNWRNENGGC